MDTADAKMERIKASLGKEITSEELDEIVHSLKSCEASAINNQGIDAQIAYMLDNMNEQEVLTWLKENKE